MDFVPGCTGTPLKARPGSNMVAAASGLLSRSIGLTENQLLSRMNRARVPGSYLFKEDVGHYLGMSFPQWKKCGCPVLYAG
jgi:hypothetical protein